MKIHSSCKIEDFVETHLCKLSVCDTPIARTTSCVSSLRIYILLTVPVCYIFRAQTDENHPVDPDSYTVVVRGVADLYP